MRRMPPDPEDCGAWGLVDSCQAVEEVVVVDMALDSTQSHAWGGLTVREKEVEITSK